MVEGRHQVWPVETPQLLAQLLQFGLAREACEADAHARLREGSIRIEQRLLEPAEKTEAAGDAPIPEDAVRCEGGEFPGNLAQPVGQLLPVLEVVVGAMLVLGLLTRGAAVLSSILFVGFIVGIASVWARGLTIDCGCFGGGGYDPDAASKYPWEIARDSLLLLASVYLVWLPSTRLSLDTLLLRRTPEIEGS